MNFGLRVVAVAAATVVIGFGALSSPANAASCSLFGNLKSVNSGTKIALNFVNRSGGYRVVMWLDYQGRPIDYKALNNGESYRQSTFVGHPWMITDGPGNCRQIVVPKRSRRVTIRR
ncbi:MAG: hypothetical protein AAFQ45_00100 [Pseudomonadota bacterium]